MNHKMKVVCRWYHPAKVIEEKECAPEQDGKETDTICEMCMKQLDREEKNRATLAKTRFELSSAFYLMGGNPGWNV